MKKEYKNILIDNLTELINNSNHFYLTDTSNLNASDTSLLRRKCFDKDIELVVVKNTLFKKALEKTGKEFNELTEVLNGSTSVMFSNSGSIPAKLIKEFRKRHDKPILKAAYVEESIYIGDEQLNELINIKSKEELVGDIINMLQSPIKNIISSLQSGGNKLAGIVKTLSEKQ